MPTFFFCFCLNKFIHWKEISSFQEFSARTFVFCLFFLNHRLNILFIISSLSAAKRNVVNPPDIKKERFTKKQSLAKPDRPQQINRAQWSKRLRQTESSKPCAGRIKTSSGVNGRRREMGEYSGEQRLLLPGSEVVLICYPPQKAVIVYIYPVWSRATTKRMDSARARIIV